MHYLIDGHNLIGQMPNIDLSDIDDEILLLERVKSWVVADNRRKVTLFFDRGIVGGKSAYWSSGLLRVFFAPMGRTADQYIMNTIDQMVDVRAHTVITNDREILQAAKRRGVPYVRSSDFVVHLLAEEQMRYAPDPEPDIAVDPEPDVSDMSEWLDMFGGESEVKLSGKPRRPKPILKPDRGPKEPPPPPRKADQLKDSGEKLTADEVGEWLNLFASETPTQDVANKREQPIVRVQKKERRFKEPSRSSRALKESGAALNKDEIDEWMKIFKEGSQE